MLCVTICPYIMEEIKLSIQTNGSIKYKLNTHGGVMQNKLYCILKYLVDERGCEIDNYND